MINLRRVVLLILLVTCVNAVYSDSLDFDKIKDSLNTLLNNKKIALELRIQGINDLSYQIINRRPDLALEYVSKAVSLNSGEEQIKTQLSNSYTILGIIYKNKGYRELSVTNYLKALNYAEETGDSLRVSVCLNNIGVLYFMSGKEREAIDYYRKSVNIERQYSNQGQLSVRYYNLAESFQKIGEYDSAFHYYVASLELEELLNNNEGEMYGHYGLATLFYDWGKLRKSESHLKSAELLMDSVQNIELECKMLIAKGDLTKINGMLEESTKNYEEAMKIAKEYEYLDLEITALEKLKDVYVETKDRENESAILNILYARQKEKSNDEIGNKIRSLEKLYGLEVKQREIEGLKAKQEIQQLSIDHSRRLKNFLFLAMIMVIGIFAFNIYRLNKMRKNE